jgi:antirestriction protein ArdC
MKLYEELTARIIAELAKGRRPWEQPWSVGLPYNGVTHHEYSGVNVLILWLAMQDNHFRHPIWYTFKQASSLGFKVKYGSRSSRICYISTYEKEVDGKKRKYQFLKWYGLFNQGQLEGVDVPVHLPEPQEYEIRQFIERIRFTLINGGLQAYYHPTHDHISMPDVSLFKTWQKYYSTLLHELVHWTGHPDRLNRNYGKYGENAYAFEELVAELGSHFLCAQFNIEMVESSTMYIASWIQMFTDHPKILFKASRKASEAVYYLRGEHGQLQGTQGTSITDPSV